MLVGLNHGVLSVIKNKRMRKLRQGYMHHGQGPLGAQWRGGASFARNLDGGAARVAAAIMGNMQIDVLTAGQC